MFAKDHVRQTIANYFGNNGKTIMNMRSRCFLSTPENMSPYFHINRKPCRNLLS